MGIPKLLGLEPDKPKKEPKAQETQLDPNRGKAVSEANRRARLSAAAQGRSGFRIDLGSGPDGRPTRSGISLQ